MRSLAADGGKQDASRRIFLCFLVYILLHWVSSFWLYFAKLGFGYQSVVEYYLGCEEKFMQPRSMLGMLEVSHFHFFSAGLLLLTITHLLLPLGKGAKRSLIYLCFGSALLDIISGWLVRFVHPTFAWLKITSFWCLQISLGWVIFILLVHFWSSGKGTVKT